MSKPKILFLSADLSHLGGITQYNIKFINALRSLGAEVSILERPRGGFLAKAFFILSFFLKVLVLRFDFVIATNVNFSPLAFFSKKFFGIPYSLTVYGIEVADVKSRSHQEGLRNADIIVKLFNQAERDIVRQFPETANRFVRVPNSVDGRAFNIIRPSSDLLDRLGINPQDKIILTIARISKQDGDNKGYERVIKALPAIRKKIPSARYLLVGTGNDVDRTKQLVADLGVSDAVIFAGSPSNEEMPLYYNIADVFVLPSKNEGFPPIVLLEALACGTPVIGGGQPDARVPLWEKDLAIIVSPDSVDEIEGAIVKVLAGEAPSHFYNRPELRQRAISEYGLDKHRKYVEQFMNKIVAK